MDPPQWRMVSGVSGSSGPAVHRCGDAEDRRDIGDGGMKIYGTWMTIYDGYIYIYIYST